MTDKNEIPECTEKPEKIKDESEKNFAKWVTYLTNLHPRVRVLDVREDSKTAEEYLTNTVAYLDQRSTYLKMTGTFKMPEDTKIILIVMFDSSVKEEEPQYAVEHSIALCSGKKAWVCDWGVGGIEVKDPKKKEARVGRAISYEPIIRQWGYATRAFIGNLKYFLKKSEIPPLPKDKPALA